MPAPRAGKAPGLLEHLAAQAAPKPVNNVLSLDKYYRSADLLLRQADTYRASANEEQLYVMLMRYASLVVETIPKHKDYRSSDPSYTKLKRVLLDKYLSELESLKLSLRTRDIVDPVAHTKNRPLDVVPVSTSMLPSVNWGPAPPGAAPQPQMPAEPRVDDLLDILATGSQSSRPSQQQQQHQTMPSAPSSSMAMQGVYQPKYSMSYSLSSSAAQDKHSLFSTRSSSGPSSRYQQTSVPRAVDMGSYPRYPTLESPSPLEPQVQQMSLFDQAQPPIPPAEPSAPHEEQQRQQEQWQEQQRQQPPPPPPEQYVLPPPSAGIQLGPQELEVLSMPSHQPGLPGTCSMQHTPPSAPALPEGGPKEVTKRAQLRDVHISVALMEEFLRYAASNTVRNVESCGILAGRLSANDSLFTITTLIIPKQEGTSDTVQALNEEEVFDVQFQRELYPLGWIHTHPSQTCFLSSVDVHTQCGYQTMLEEAVAIVMAPRDSTKKCGLFRLTTPGGLSLVQKCNLRGFHAHPQTGTGQELYELCGHVYLNPRAKHETIDLR